MSASLVAASEAVANWVYRCGTLERGDLCLTRKGALQSRRCPLSGQVVAPEGGNPDVAGMAGEGSPEAGQNET